MTPPPPTYNIFLKAQVPDALNSRRLTTDEFFLLSLRHPDSHWVDSKWGGWIVRDLGMMVWEFIAYDWKR